MSDLPAGWERTTVGDLAKVAYGKGLGANLRDQSGDVPVVGSAGIVGFHSAALIDDPAIVIGRKGNAGSVWLLDRPSWPIDTTYLLRIPAGINRRFFAHQLRHMNLGRFDSSTAIPSLRRGDLESAAVGIPPRREQDRIVDALEQHLSRVDAAEVALQSARRRVRALDQAVLTRAQAEGDELTLDDLLLGIEAGKSFKTPGRRAKPDEWGVIKVSAMTWGEFDADENKAIPAGGPIDPRYEICPGDLLLSRANTSEYVGATVLVDACRPRLLLSDKSMRLLTRDGVDRRWLRFALGSPQVRSQMSLLATGTSDSMRNISQAKVRGLRVRIPRTDRQEILADEIEDALRARWRLEVDLQAARSRAMGLRRAILAAAFSGTLVPQDPDDEPASLLLERIRGQRAAATPTRRARMPAASS